MSKATQRKKPGYTKNGDVKLVSLNVHQLAPMLATTSNPKKKAQIQRRLDQLGYVAPVAVVEEASD